MRGCGRGEGEGGVRRSKEICTPLIINSMDKSGKTIQKKTFWPQKRSFFLAYLLTLQDRGY
ncbi:MAG TPA: hypothetical protein DEA79_14430 [Cyanobacteria bacterium UBA11153]|nr:hypothetical protein [Cyanobacteria bacterium UBA11153]